MKPAHPSMLLMEKTPCKSTLCPTGDILPDNSPCYHPCFGLPAQPGLQNPHAALFHAGHKEPGTTSLFSFMSFPTNLFHQEKKLSTLITVSPSLGHICSSFIRILPGINVRLTSLELQESFHLSFYMQKGFKGGRSPKKVAGSSA